MNIDDRQFERIARWLDGEAVDLTGDELAAAERFSRIERSLGGGLDAAAPREALSRAGTRMLAELARPAHGIISLRRVARSAAVAAAAALLIFALLADNSGRPTPMPARAGDDGLLYAMAESFQPSIQNADLDVLAMQMDLLESDITVRRRASAEDIRIDELQQDIEDFFAIEPISTIDD